MRMQTVQHALLLAALVLTANRALAMGEILGETKEQLKLQYDVTVHDHGNGRVSIEFTLADEGRMKPLSGVEVSIPAPAEKDGSNYYDLSVPLEMKKSADGKQVGRFEMRKDWAQKGQIWLNTYWFDGKQLVMTHYHHMIPLAPYLKNLPAAPAQPGAAPAAEPPAAGPPAAERKRD